MQNLSIPYISKNIPFRLMKVIQKPLMYHTIFWLIYFLFNVLRWGSYFDDYFYSFSSNLIGFPIHIVLAYFQAYYLFPKFIPQRQYLPYFALLLLALLVMMYVKIILNYYLVSPVVWRESILPQENLFGINHMITVMLGEVYVMAFTGAIKITSDWMREQRKNLSLEKRALELEKRTLETELSFLKSQIQPHFFFNTLNNLYALTLQKSDQAPAIVLKLSDLMSYVLYEANAPRMALRKEINYLQNYIDLERLRYGDRLKLNFELSGSPDGYQIAPLVLLPFVENAFKHSERGFSRSLEINISLAIQQKRLYLEVENNKPLQKTVSDPKSGGIGLKNIRRQLDLLYHDQYQLDIDEQNEKYRVVISIPLE
ncbi:MAG: sensor histidine kinase [Bacteroidetes bacterium]|nr:MAG: sensor histidine kinase [Bacteroidota bacterium]